MKYIKLFENFSWDYLKNNNKSLGDFYADKLETFDLEQTILEKLDVFETRVEEVFSDRWNLNRGRSYSNYSSSCRYTFLYCSLIISSSTTRFISYIYIIF